MKSADSAETLSERVLAAWRALPPEGPRNQRPSYRVLEERFGLPNGIFSRIIKGRTHDLTLSNAKQIALALNVSLTWLAGDEEKAPVRAHTPEAARALAIEWARWEDVDERAIDMVVAGPLYHYSPRVWLALIDVYAANLRLRGT